MAIPHILAQLEVAINAVEPRVLEGYSPGLSNAEIDAIMANEPFDLPTDLRALYRWRNGAAQQRHGIIGPGCWMLSLASGIEKPGENSPPFTLQDASRYIREENRMFYEMAEEPPPFDLDAREFFYLFDDGGDGTTIVALWRIGEKETCEIWKFDPADFPVLYPMFDNVEAMATTALAWWQEGVFAPFEHRFGWDLEVDWNKYREIRQRLNES